VVYGAAGKEYSQKISDRVAPAWQTKKRNGALGIAITSHLPGWLCGKNGEAIKVDEARAKIVRRIFEWCAAGAGQRTIDGKPTTSLPPSRNPWKKK